MYIQSVSCVPDGYWISTLTVAGELKDLIRNIIDEYSKILEKIAASVLPIALKIEALGTMALSKMEHYFPNINFSEDNLAELDKVLMACLRKMFDIYTKTTLKTMFINNKHALVYENRQQYTEPHELVS